jgi:radical SAM superfamily enzyme YgiQ (UPF0313 family)
MRILLIAPGSGYSIPGWIRVPQLSLNILKTLSGEGHQVTMVEEDFDLIPLEEKWDLVGITATTAAAFRAYALAAEFRKRGARVVLGGIHPSVLPEEAAQHADAVLVGEAEGFWEIILEDASRNELKPIYYNPLPETMEVPLVDYQKNKGWGIPPLIPVVATRGCPQGCEFCSVPRIYGSRVRKVPVQQVLEQVRRSNGHYVGFLDDNLTADRNYALELFAGLRPLNIKFLAQVTVKCLLDDVLFQAAVAAGLTGVLVGFEALEENAHKRLKKSASPADCGEAIRKCRDAKVMVHGSFIVGMDEHDKSIFNHLLDFIMEHQIFSVSAHILTPYPGTPLFDRLAAEGRVLHQNWSYYDNGTPVFIPNHLTLTELTQGFVQFHDSVFKLSGILRRLPTGLAVNPYIFLQMNAAKRRTTSKFRDHYKNYFNYLATACPEVEIPRF